MKKAILWILGILAAIVIAVACVWGGEIRTISSIESVDGNPYLYRMEYKAASDLDEGIAQEDDSNAELLDYVVGRIGKGRPTRTASSPPSTAPASRPRRPMGAASGTAATTIISRTRRW